MHMYLDSWVQCVSSQFKSDLIIALARRPMGDILCLLIYSNLDHCPESIEVKYLLAKLLKWLMISTLRCMYYEGKTVCEGIMKFNCVCPSSIFERKQGTVYVLPVVYLAIQGRARAVPNR